MFLLVFHNLLNNSYESWHWRILTMPESLPCTEAKISNAIDTSFDQFPKSKEWEGSSMLQEAHVIDTKPSFYVVDITTR